MNLLLAADVRGVRNHVELVLLLVSAALMEPEEDTTAESEHGNGTVVPDEKGIFGDGGEGLAKSGGEGRHEVPVRSDERSHVLGRLGESELETRNGREDLGETDERVGRNLHPDADGGGVVALVHVGTARSLLVDFALDDAGGDHSRGSEDETKSHTLDGGEADTLLAEEWVQDVVNDGDEDNEGDGVDVSDDIVGETVQDEGVGLRGQVVVHLVVREPVKGNPREA